jgi:hypothetical protein
VVNAEYVLGALDWLLVVRRLLQRLLSRVYGSGLYWVDSVELQSQLQGYIRPLDGVP